MLVWVFSVYLYLFVCSVACYRVLDPFRRSGPIQWQFEDLSMRWSVNQYRFVQWRPDSDSALKLRHFKWVFLFIILWVFLFIILWVFYFSVL